MENLPGVPDNQYKHFDLSGVKVRYYHCGEYGSENGRPHYHALLFNYDFKDKVFWKKKLGNILWVSETLNKLWEKGYCAVGNVTFESAAYVARYIMKKMNGEKALDHYPEVGINPDTGEIIQVQAEYTTMSRRNGIGHDWFKKFTGDVFPSDQVIMRGREMKPPKYYDDIYDLTNHNEMSIIKHMRKLAAEKNAANNTTTRLIQREKCKRAQTNFLIRSFENA